MSATDRRQGLAITSMVLGILSLVCMGIITGIPAIILGHVAHRKARKTPEQFGGAGFAIAGWTLGYVSIITTFILLGLLLPALAKFKAQAHGHGGDRDRSQSIKCVNNMKNIGLAFRIWATDHNDAFPFHISTAQGGVLETNLAGGKPVQLTSARVFRVLANELSTPKILVCPADSGKEAAPDFDSLEEDNVSYQLEIGPEVRESNPEQVLATCPIHGHVVLCDGSVQQGRGW